MRCILWAIILSKHPGCSPVHCSQTLELCQQTQSHVDMRGLAGHCPQAGLLTGPRVAAALGHSPMAKLAGCLRSFNTLGSNVSCHSYFWLCFGLQRREVGASVSLLSSLFEVKPNKRGPTLITSVLSFLVPPPQAGDPACTRPHIHI